MRLVSGSHLRRVITGAWPTRTLACVIAFSLAGCPNGSGDTTPTRKVRVRVRSFTEPAPVKLIAAARQYAFTVSATGLDRWDLRSGARLHLSADHGLPGDAVTAVTHDPSRGTVWIATDGGVTRYDVESGTFSALPPAPQVLGLEGFGGASLAPAGDGGLWVGHARGLFYTNPEGAWSPTPVNAPVTALLRDGKGRLWIGTRRGLMVREASGETYEYGDDQGCDLAEVRLLELAPDDGPMIVGDTRAGQQRVVFIRDGVCATYRASPDIRWKAAARRGGETIILTAHRLFSMKPMLNRARRLTRDGMRLMPVKVGPEGQKFDTPFAMTPIDMRISSRATALGTIGDEILVGTHDLGVARINRASSSTRWLRRGELVDGATSLSVACAAANDCYVATGTSTAWRFDGKRFHPFGEGEPRILAFARGPGGKIYGLRESDDFENILLAPIRDSIWVRVSEVAISTPGGRPGISFARFAPSGVLWVGLRYTDDAGESRPFGVALVDVGLGAVVYHHESRDSRERKQGVLPIPINASDACFLTNDEVWLATSEGAARVRGQNVQVFTESDGLTSELLRGVACSAGGMVYVASGPGVGGFDGDAWSYPKTLRFPVNDLELGRDGRLWMATDRGLAVYDGARVRRLDVRRGLLQNQVEDVSLDHLGRVWVRGSEGITVVTP